MLLFVHGETRVDEQGGVLAFLGAAYGEERGEAALHGPYGGDAAGGVDIDVEEVFGKTGNFLFQFGKTAYFRIEGGHAVLQGFDFGFHAYLGGRQAGDAHFHADETGAGGLLDVVDQFLHFPDGGFAHAGKSVGLDGFIHNSFGDNCFFHRISYFLIFNLLCGNRNALATTWQEAAGES